MFLAATARADFGSGASGVFTVDTRDQGGVGNGFSGLFQVDTRYGVSLGSAVSSLLTVDTRHSGVSGSGDSGLFLVNTLGLPGLSSSLSRVVVSPASLAADGLTPATATVTLLDGKGNPMAGKWVTVSAFEQFSAGGAATLSSIAQPANPTDNHGQATATLTSAQAGSALISAQDVTDGLALVAQATVQFLSGSVAPDPALKNAIVQLSSSTSNLLVGSIAQIAVEEGHHGDYFQGAVLSDNAQQELSALSTFVGSLTALVGGGDLLVEALKSLGIDAAFYGAGEAADTLASHSTGLSAFGQAIANRDGSYQGTLAGQESACLAGVSPGANQYVTDYTQDLALRQQANESMKALLSSQDSLLLCLEQNSGVGHGDSFTPLFMAVNVVGAVAGTALAGGDYELGGVAASEALNAAEGFATFGGNQRNLNNDRNAYHTAEASLIDCAYFSRLINANTASALDNIARARRPSPVTGVVGPMQSVKTYRPLSGITGLLAGWAGLLGNTTYVEGTGAYSLVTIKNTSPQRRTFSVHAFYSYSINMGDVGGVYLGTITAPLVLSVNTNIPAGQSAQVKLTYAEGGSGAAPDNGSVISMIVLGYDGNSGVYAVGDATSTVQWQAEDSAMQYAKPLPSDGPLPRDATNLFAVETPIQSCVLLDPSNQTYHAQIKVANPFAIPLVATVTQSLPAGLMVVATDGALNGSALVWTNSLPTNGLAVDSFTFTFGVTPGVQTSLPPASVVFRDATPTNSLTVQSAPASFAGLLPVQVSGYVPVGVAGSATGMPLGLTNLSVANQVGTLLVSVFESGGNAVATFSQAFALDPGSGTNLLFSLPGTWPPGSYLVTGSLDINGCVEQVFAGAYVVPPVPVTLVGAPVAGGLANGFTLALQGAAGVGYLIEASTDLTDWEPIEYLVGGGSLIYYTDYYAPYYSQRFYRAVPVGQVAAPVAPELGLPVLLPGGAVQVMLYGGVGQSYTVQVSSNLVDWVAVTNLALPDGSGQFTDYGATSYGWRFYRAVVP